MLSWRLQTKGLTGDFGVLDFPLQRFVKVFDPLAWK